jgi:hypothetical protein
METHSTMGSQPSRSPDYKWTWILTRARDFNVFEKEALVTMSP